MLFFHEIGPKCLGQDLETAILDGGLKILRHNNIMKNVIPTMLVDDLNQSGTSFRQRISNQFHCQKEALQRECSTEQGQIDLFFRQKYQHVLPLSLMAHNGQYQYNVLILYLGGQGTAESGRDIRINVKPVFICGLKSK